jgi:hypothetical protein
MGFGSPCTQSGWNFFRCSATDAFIFAADATVQDAVHPSISHFSWTGALCPT